MLWMPSASLIGGKVTTPLVATPADPSTVVPSLNVTLPVQHEACDHIATVDPRVTRGIGKLGLVPRDECGRRILRQFQIRKRLARIDVEPMLAVAIGVHDLGASRVRSDREEGIDTRFRAARQCHGKGRPAALYLAVGLRLLPEVRDSLARE